MPKTRTATSNDHGERKTFHTVAVKFNGPVKVTEIQDAGYVTLTSRSFELKLAPATSSPAGLMSARRKETVRAAPKFRPRSLTAFQLVITPTSRSSTYTRTP